MIWVETDVEITKHIFSKNEPKNPIEGMVWIYLSNSSSVSFHTLNINGKEFDEVYPLSTKQYINGIWVDKTAKSHQSGEWAEWCTYLFLEGVGSLVDFEIIKINDNGTVTISNEAITITNNGGGGSEVCVRAKEPINLAPFTTLVFKARCTESNSGSYQGKFIISADAPVANTVPNANTTLAMLAVEADSTLKEYKIPLDNINQTAYIAIWGWMKMDVTNIWLE